MNITIKQFSPTVFYTSGVATFCFRNCKSVTVEGEIYTKYFIEENITDLDEQFLKDNEHLLSGRTKYPWMECKTDFLHLFDLPEITLYSYCKCFRYASNYNLSENPWVAAMRLLSELNKFPYKLYTVDKETWNINKKEIPVFAFVYGFNNAKGFYLPYKDIIKYKIERKHIAGRPLFYDDPLFNSFFPKEWKNADPVNLLIEYINFMSVAKREKIFY